MTRRNLVSVAPAVSGGFAGFLFNVPFGPRPVLDNPENLGAQVLERIQANHTETKTILGKVEERQGKADTTLGEVKSKVEEFDSRLADVEQKQARRGNLGAPAVVKSWGQRFVEPRPMTAINALVRRDRVHVVTDGAVYQPDGAVVGSMQKVYILAHADAVLAYRGPSYIGPTLYGCLNASCLTGFDDLLSKLMPAVLHTLNSLELLDQAAVAEANARLDLRRADVVVAGWSRERGRGEIYKLDTSAEEWRLEPQGDGLMMPGDNPALLARLKKHGWDLANEQQDERRLLELLHHQRALADTLPNGTRFCTVGRFA